MPGASLKFEIKKMIKIAEAEELGKLKAQQKMRRLTHELTPKSFILSAREHFGKLIDTMTFRDVVDIVAAIGLTTVIHDTIKTMKNIVETLSNVTITGLKSIFGPNLFSSSQGFFDLIGFGSLYKQWTTSEEPTPKPEEEQLPVFLGWLLSFAIAWIIVKWGDKLLSEGINSVPLIIGLLTKG